MNKLGLRELIRYGYTGVLCAFVAAVVDGARTERLVKSLGDVLSPLAALAVGAAVYVIFKALVGDLFLWRLNDWSHTKVENLLGRKVTRCKVRYLEDQHSVSHGKGQAAFALVRDSLLSEAVRERFHVQPSESYLVFVTAFVCGLVSLLAYAGLLPSEVSPWKSAGLGAAAALSFAAGEWHDIVLCRAECAALGLLNQEELRTTLRDGGFLEK
jgi:hypothetical protein